MALKDEAAVALRRAAALPAEARTEAIEEAFPDRPLLRSTLEGLLTEDDTSWLQTGGAWNPQFEDRILDTVRREPLALGDRVGDLRIKSRLGSGGMGTVYLGFDERLEREVAIKTVSADGRVRPQARERFEREAKVLSRLNHPAICQIYSVVDGSVGEHTFQCLVLERVRGETLRAAIGELDFEARLRVLEQVARALAVAHREGIIHRDLKPDNVMLTPEGEVKILDFGISRFSDAETPASAQETEELDETGGRLIGTPRYMSPEQAMCEPLSPASDLYSLGLLLREAVTDRPAYAEASTPYEMVRRAARAEVEPLGEEVDPEIGSLIGDLLAREPSHRPTAEEAADRIRRVLDRPLRIRRRLVRLAVASVVAIALAAAVWATLSAWQTRRDVERRSVAARRLGEEVRAVDGLLRAAHLAPAHDVRRERKWVEERLRWIHDEFAGSEAWVVGPKAYARGRIALALGRPEEARAALEEGWDAGYHDPQLAEALGLALGRLYDRATSEARRLETADQRRVALETAERTLRLPAVEWLARSRESDAAGGLGGGAGGGSISLADAWIALYENRFADARDHAVRAVSEAPWLYEALRVRGLASMREAAELEEEGRMEEAGRRLADAEAAFDEALRVARSDPELHLERCRLGDETIALAYRTGSDAQAPYERSIEACRAARDLLPGDPEPWLAEALIEYILAWSRSEVLRDPTEALDRLRIAAERGLELAPESAEAYRLLGLEATDRAQWATTEGRSGRSDFGRARQLLTRAAEIEPERSSHRYALGVALFSLGFEEMLQGVDPRPTLRKAADALREAQRLEPAAYSALSMMGSTYGVMAMYSLEHGLDPVDLLERSIRSFETALDIEPAAPAPRGNLAMAYRDLATYRWLVSDDPAAIEAAVDAGRQTAEALIAAKPDSIARITLGELELIRARARLDRGVEASGAIGSALRQAAELEDLGVVGTDALRLRSEALYLHARAAAGRTCDVGVGGDVEADVDELTRRAWASTADWLEAGGGHQTWLLRARLALLRARSGLGGRDEIQQGLDAADRSLEIRPDGGDALLVKARLLALAGRKPAEIRAALAAAVESNPWLQRQAQEVEAEIETPVS